MLNTHHCNRLADSSAIGSVSLLCGNRFKPYRGSPNPTSGGPPGSAWDALVLLDHETQNRLEGLKTEIRALQDEVGKEFDAMKEMQLCRVVPTST